MRIELLYVPECPNVAEARARLRAALDQVAVEAEVVEREVASSEEAWAIGMNGSPTFLVEGRDLFGGPSPSFGCRLYRSEGSVEGAPTVSALVEALTR